MEEALRKATKWQNRVADLEWELSREKRDRVALERIRVKSEYEKENTDLDQSQMIESFYGKIQT